MDNELYHYGVKGQKWGVRRYQKKDGSLTPAGKKRTKKLRASKEARQSRREAKAETKAYQKAYMKDAEAAYKRAGIKNFNPKTGDYTIDKNGTYRHKKTGAVISQKDFKLAWDYSAEQRYRKERAQQWLMASPILAVSAASIVAVGADYALNKR